MLREVLVDPERDELAVDFGEVVAKERRAAWMVLGPPRRPFRGLDASRRLVEELGRLFDDQTPEVYRRLL